MVRLVDFMFFRTWSKCPLAVAVVLGVVSVVVVTAFSLKTHALILIEVVEEIRVVVVLAVLPAVETTLEVVVAVAAVASGVLDARHQKRFLPLP